jgi:hypothetical protein
MFLLIIESISNYFTLYNTISLKLYSVTSGNLVIFILQVSVRGGNLVVLFFVSFYQRLS